jgi:protein-tyrosine phosphatase
MKKVLFVCLGNICRSPLAEGLAKHVAKEKGISDKVHFDSCGTSKYHIGDPPDERTIANALKNGIKLDQQARQFEKKDFREFDYILAMDSNNLNNIKILDQTGQFGDKLHLMRDFDTENPGGDVTDPFFGGEEGFKNVYDILNRSVTNFIEKKLV